MKSNIRLNIKINEIEEGINLIVQRLNKQGNMK
ncbi:hypothetical protein SAMN05444407_11071 [Chryseobacterium contaminans]|uniref:Uncharacterized protein n=1 Tax=Chryseobacterium contaminans TaxID=1423959 RepID=A0A1M7GKU1_9FLAO|nr:hypothetical protein SAMN05444407_11071 [Chryseobacterium contaminans]